MLSLESGTGRGLGVVFLQGRRYVWQKQTTKQNNTISSDFTTISKPLIFLCFHMLIL